MTKKGKRYREATSRYDRDEQYTGSEALGLVRDLAAAGFEETVDLVVRLGVDPRKAEEMIRGTVALPSGTGRSIRVAVFAQGEAASAALEAGADPVGADGLAAQVGGGGVECIASLHPFWWYLVVHGASAKCSCKVTARQ